MELKELSSKDLIKLKKKIELEIEKRKKIEALAMHKKIRDSKKSSNNAKVYVNPQNPWDTWSGRGRKPNWVNEAIKNGMKLSDLELK